jgi:hypothetical protein
MTNRHDFDGRRLLEWHRGWTGPIEALSRAQRYDDSVVMQGSLERPQLLIQNGRPAHPICTTADGPGGIARAAKAWSTVIPLREDRE